ncbi:MAG: epoxyqueuosine reductase QueH [Rickettsiales bacterium]|jgi:predicted adenine nucleotide alpha hydrolase (AANH) superfamily ATPase|nr:epoxyqueuosine reductase QueH [Rickettsiales bacterium]
MEQSIRKIAFLSCCAPCSAGTLSSLYRPGRLPCGADFIVLFMNPNIYPAEEYQKRLAEQIKLCKHFGVKYAVGEYDHDKWRAAVRGLEGEPERGKRCMECFKYRFALAAEWARANGYDAIASSFGVSKYKDRSQIDAAALSVIPASITYLPGDFAKGDTNPQGLPKQNPGINIDMYRQKYCGCEFSETYPKELKKY